MGYGLAAFARQLRKRYVVAASLMPGCLRTLLCVSLLACAAIAVPFSNPPILASTAGVLSVNLDAVEATIVVQGQPLTRELYNATLDPPVFRVKQGDTFHLELTNFLAPATSTNIHWHGLKIAPVAGADKIFDEILPNNSYTYNFQIPLNHPVGTFWYHSHAMEFSEAQVYQGMSGIFIIDPPGSISDLFPQLGGKQERIFPLRELAYLYAPRVQLINLLSNPTIDMLPGDIEYWRFANIAANNRYTINFPAGVTAVRVSSDGHYLNKPVTVTAITLMTGERADVILKAGSAGTYQVTTQEVDMFNSATGDGSSISLVSVVVAGAPVAPVDLPTSFEDLLDLREMKPHARRSFQLSSNVNETQYYINGIQYDPSRTDVTVELGTLEEWTIENLDVASGEKRQQLHSFHMHQLPFQVISIAGVPQPFNGYVDTVAVEPGQKVVIRLFFNDENVLGKFVFHCHILLHEDLGMMQVIDLVPSSVAGRALASVGLVMVMLALLLLVFV